LLGPFNQIPLAAVGGVNKENVNAYLNTGAKAVGVGSSLFGRQAIERKQADKILANVKVSLA